MRLYKESDINAVYMSLRNLALRRGDELVPIKQIYNEFEWLKDNCCNRIITQQKAQKSTTPKKAKKNCLRKVCQYYNDNDNECEAPLKILKQYKCSLS